MVRPGRHYALEFVFNHPALQGSLLAGGSTVVREYYLPDSGVDVPRAGPTTAFGNLATSRNTMSLKSSAIAPEKISFQFISNESVAYDITDFGRYTLREYDPERLPIVIESWTPYRAKVDTPEPAWLETPRIFIEGYAATVDGRPAPVQRSPSGLAMVAVEPGEHRVTLSYPGPLVLRVSYFASLLAWAGLVVVVMRAKCRRSEPESPTGRGGPR